MATNCGNQINCGCQDSFLTTPPAVPTPGACPEAQPCSEVFDAQCVKYTGEDILCLQDIVVEQNTSVSDALQNIVEYFCNPPAPVSITADNGLNMSTPTNVQLGGLLIEDTTITTQNFDFNIVGARNSNADSILFIQNTGQGGGVVALSIANSAFTGVSTSAAGGFFTSQSNSGVVSVTSSFNVPCINGESVGLLSNGKPVGLKLVTQTTSALPSNGIANKIQYALSHDNSGSNNLTESNEIISTFTDVSSATLTSDLIFKGRYRGSALSDLVTFKGSGEVRLHEYGVGNFVNTPAYMLGVDASGNIVEVAL